MCGVAGVLVQQPQRPGGGALRVLRARQPKVAVTAGTVDRKITVVGNVQSAEEQVLRIFPGRRHKWGTDDAKYLLPQTKLCNLWYSRATTFMCTMQKCTLLLGGVSAAELDQPQEDL